jgi:hypothetical protein
MKVLSSLDCLEITFESHVTHEIDVLHPDVEGLVLDALVIQPRVVLEVAVGEFERTIFEQISELAEDLL